MTQRWTDYLLRLLPGRGVAARSSSVAGDQAAAAAQLQQSEGDQLVDYVDLPIKTPDQDLFGLDPFARSLAAGISKMHSPEGVVIAINGPWGSGKSSAINLLKHHMRSAVEAGDLQIVTFNPWWFRGEEALVLAFFRELHTATNPSLGSKAKKLLPKLGARLLKAGGAVGAGADLLGAGGAGAVASNTLDWASELIEDKESVEQLHRELSKALGNQRKRFIVVIDDIDRLGPDEALAMFRLVKSVGLLPNVIYLLAFDRLLAEKVVQERFPSEGPHYLEKIIQASFELPVPDPAELHAQLLSRISTICGEPDEPLLVDFMNLFHEIVAPEIRKPRDVFRFVNALSVTWPAVAGEVNLGDFVAIEAYRVFRPSVYQSIRANASALCGAAGMGWEKVPQAGEKLDALLLSGVEDKDRYRRGLMRLFPKLESIWSNVHHGHDAILAKQRRVCVKEHFPTYFRFALGDETLSQQEIRLLVENASDQKFVIETLLNAVQTKRRSGGTKAALLLESLVSHATDIPVDRVESLLSAVFSVADDVDVEADQARGFMTGNNSLRIHWLMRALLLDRTTLDERSAILMGAAKNASLSWLVNLAGSTWDDYHPREGREPQSEEKSLVTEADATTLRARAAAAIRDAAENGTLIPHPDLDVLLYRWKDFADDKSKAVKVWTRAALEDNHSVARLAAAFTSHTWSQGMGIMGLGDLVAKRSDRASVEHLNEIMDRDRFRARVEELAARDDLPLEDLQAIRRFLDAWRWRDEHGDR